VLDNPPLNGFYLHLCAWSEHFAAYEINSHKH